LGDDLEHTRVAPGGDIVHHLGAEVECSFSDKRMMGIDCESAAQRKCADNRLDTSPFGLGSHAR
jgi:hypothetical protein